MRIFQKALVWVVAVMLMVVPVYANNEPTPGEWAIFNGTVETVARGNGNAITFILQNDEGERISFSTATAVVADTVGMVSHNQIEVGAEVLVYYIVPEVVAAIYPPQLEASVVILLGSGTTVAFLANVTNVSEINSGAVLSNLTVDVVGGVVMNDEQQLQAHSLEISVHEVAILTGTDGQTLQSVDLSGETVIMQVRNLNFSGGGTHFPSVNRLTVFSPPEPSETEPEPAEDDGIRLTIGSTEMIIGGNAIDMAVAPYISEGRTMVPVHYVGMAFNLQSGQDIIWDSETRTVTIITGGTIAAMTIGSTTMTINGEEFEMDVEPEITADRTFLPIAWVARALNIAEPVWDGEARTVEFSRS